MTVRIRTVVFSYKESLFERFAQGFNDRYHDQSHTRKEAGDEGYQRPEQIKQRIFKEGQVHKELNKHTEESDRNEGCPRDIESSAACISEKSDDGAHEKRNINEYRQREGNKPITFGVIVYVEQKCPEDGKRYRAKDNGIGAIKPLRQNENGIKKYYSANGVPGPGQSVSKIQIAKQCNSNWHNAKGGQNKQHPLRTHFFAFFDICGIGRLGFFADYLGMIDRGAAKRAFIFGIGKLDTAFNTIHLYLLIFGYFQLLHAPQVNEAAQRKRVQAQAFERCGQS